MAFDLFKKWFGRVQEEMKQNLEEVDERTKGFQEKAKAFAEETKQSAERTMEKAGDMMEEAGKVATEMSKDAIEKAKAWAKEAEDTVEQIGVLRSKKQLAQADLTILLIDGSDEVTQEDQDLFALVSERPFLIVVNKTDLTERFDLQALTGG